MGRGAMRLQVFMEGFEKLPSDLKARLIKFEVTWVSIQGSCDFELCPNINVEFKEK